jgi:hypothetical protein
LGIGKNPTIIKKADFPGSIPLHFPHSLLKKEERVKVRREFFETKLNITKPMYVSREISKSTNLARIKPLKLYLPKGICSEILTPHHFCQQKWWGTVKA